MNSNTYSISSSLTIVPSAQNNFYRNFSSKTPRDIIRNVWFELENWINFAQKRTPNRKIVVRRYLAIFWAKSFLVADKFALLRKRNFNWFENLLWDVLKPFSQFQRTNIVDNVYIHIGKGQFNKMENNIILSLRQMSLLHTCLLKILRFALTKRRREGELSPEKKPYSADSGVKHMGVHVINNNTLLQKTTDHELFWVFSPFTQYKCLVSYGIIVLNWMFSSNNANNYKNTTCLSQCL